jgi:ADP-ribose pyrophosphatase YjhB (NUDIX family)
VSSSSSGVVGLLAEPERLRVVSALALGATTIPEVAAASGLDPRAVVRAVRRLERGGLVSREKDQLTLHADRFRESAREAAPAEPGPPLSDDPATDAVLRAFTRDGQITSFPGQRTRRRLLLEHVAAIFEPGVRYPEKDVNAILRSWYGDYAALRRYLVDELLLDRADGLYWRIGGPVAVDPPAPDLAGEPVERFQRIAAYALLRDEDRVLLTRLSRNAYKGRWTLPGGGLDFGERPTEAVLREVYEETGLTVRVEELLDADAERFRQIGRVGLYEAHAVRFLYRATVLGGTLRVVEVGGTTDDARWWPLSQLPELTPFVHRVLTTGRLNP